MRLFFATIAAVCISLPAVAAFAGGGPENVLLVVNSNSDSSKTIANHYISWRQIPACNVLYIPSKLSLGMCTANEFRDSLLNKILETLEDQKLAPQIDYIVYSTDFPWRVNMRPFFPDQKFRPELDPTASLNGATYLASFILSENPDIVAPNTNWYVPDPHNSNLMQCQNLANVSSRGFHSRYLWDQKGEKTHGVPPGQRYWLSTMLGVTRPRGNTVDEILRYLKRAVLADGTRPRGTIYLMWNKDVRSFTRDKCFPSIANQINAAGGRAIVQQGRIPTGAKDVAGMVVGASDFSLAKDGIQILPGAICEHLTSEGGIFGEAGQTPLSEFLRHGAAGASGTVVEPHAIQAKFPLASIQLHYVRGCSLAEAFYQSVAGPYQLLIVGDPLCQPWATIPTIAVGGVKANETVKGSIVLTPSGPSSIGTFELFIDGRRAAQLPPGRTHTLDTTKLADGFHELRVVGIRSDAIETQGRVIVPIQVNNHDAAIDIKVASAARVSLAAKLKISVRQTGATAFAIRQNSREVGRVKGEAGEVEVTAATLGRGPTTLQAFSEGKAAGASMPVRILVE